ncbi:hypothetical protein C6P44_002344, partial [Monosporozyma unispora]
MTETDSIDQVSTQNHNLNDNQNQTSGTSNIETTTNTQNNTMNKENISLSPTQNLANTPGNNRTTSSIYNLLHSNSSNSSGSNLEESQNNNNNTTTTTNINTNVPNYESRVSPAPFISPSQSPNSLRYGSTSNGVSQQNHLIQSLKPFTTSSSSSSVQQSIASSTNNDTTNNSIPNTSLPSLIHSSPVNMPRTFHNQLPLLNRNPSALNPIQYN